MNAPNKATDGFVRQERRVYGDPASDPVGTVRDGGSPFPDGHPCSPVNRFWIKRTPKWDREIERPWVALNHEADIQLMPNDLMDDKPIVPLAHIAYIFGHPGAEELPS